MARTLNNQPQSHNVDREELPLLFPTHLHPPEFWEALGRTIATFGFLEETLGKAIFAFTGTRRFATQGEAEKAFTGWLPTLERALSDPLGGLIDMYGKAVKEHANASITNLGDLLEDLRMASTLRNVLCHGSWRQPDAAGCSVPLFVTKKMKIFDTGVDVAFLLRTRQHVAELAVSVMDTVTHMGWQFPGSNGPGKPIW
jgi:hypothetical protein